jgi:hypothetical protein
MKKACFILAIISLSFLFVNQHVNAQAMGSDYNTGIGVKVGWWGGGAISVKHFTTDAVALEGLLSFWSHGATITGLYEFHGPITGAPGLKWYVGPGAHIGFWNTKYRDEQDYGGAYFGIDGVLGLDYKFTGAPINLSLDIQPLISIPDGGFDIWGGLGIRFAL